MLIGITTTTHHPPGAVNLYHIPPNDITFHQLGSHTADPYGQDGHYDRAVSHTVLDKKRNNSAEDKQGQTAEKDRQS